MQRPKRNAKLKEAYTLAARQRGLPSAFNTAVSDFFHSPEIGAVQADVKQGMIRVEATDDFMVASVQVSLLDEASAILEIGEAQWLPAAQEWIYRMQGGLQVVQIKVNVKDLAGNEAVKVVEPV